MKSLKHMGLNQNSFSQFSQLSKLNQIKINKAGVKLQAYVTLEILCNP